MSAKEELIEGTKRLIETAFKPELRVREMDLSVHASVDEVPTYELSINGFVVSLPEDLEAGQSDGSGTH